MNSPFEAAAAPGRGIVIILNTSSGSDDKTELLARIESLLTGAGHCVNLVPLMPPQDYPAIAERAVLEAKSSGSLVVAAGGDGTINTVAALCSRHAVEMGVIPLGTFNYFARALNIPQDPVEAAAVLANGVMRPVTVGYVNDRLFLNNASFGLYTRIIRQREQDKSRFGRFRVVAFLSGLATVLRGQRAFAIKTVTAEGAQLHRTSMVFVGNNTLQLANLDLEVASCTDAGRLAVVVLKKISRLELAGLVLHGLARNLNGHSGLHMCCADTIDVISKRRRIDVVIDGEVIKCSMPLRFTQAHDALRVMVPAEGQ